MQSPYEPYVTCVICDAPMHRSEYEDADGGGHLRACMIIDARRGIVADVDARAARRQELLDAIRGDGEQAPPEERRRRFGL